MSLRAFRTLYKPPKEAGGTSPLTRAFEWLVAALIGIAFGLLVGFHL